MNFPFTHASDGDLEKKGWGPGQPQNPKPSDGGNPKTAALALTALGKGPIKEGWGPAQPQPTTPSDDGNPKVNCARDHVSRQVTA
jgi:hypothetical protein